MNITKILTEPCKGCTRRKEWLKKVSRDVRKHYAKQFEKGSNAARRIIRNGKAPPGQGKPAVGTESQDLEADGRLVPGGDLNG